MKTGAIVAIAVDRQARIFAAGFTFDIVRCALSRGLGADLGSMNGPTSLFPYFAQTEAFFAHVLSL
jgi:hypothetical protein